MYHLYHTPALVLGSSPRGEGSKHISLFTRELGLVSATATSVREERSKLRYGLQDFSYSEVTLVRGKEFWRLTRAELVVPLSLGCQRHAEALSTVGRVCALLRRLLTGEEKNEPLFLAVTEGLRFITEQTDARAIEGAEIVLVLRILYLLGYLASRNEFDPFLTRAALWDEAIISKALLFRTLAVSEINHSLKQSQL